MKKAFHYAWLIALVLCPFVLWILPADTFDDTGLLTCPSRAFFDVECFGCGMTRAVMYFHHFEFTEAFYYNALVLLVYPFLAWLWQGWVRAEFRFFKLFPAIAGKPRVRRGKAK